LERHWRCAINILVPVDSSEQALAAVRHALRLLQEGLDATLLFGHQSDGVLDTITPGPMKQTAHVAGRLRSAAPAS